MHRWKLSALAAAAFVSVALAPTDAAALALGPIRIQSALGENLRAEIAIPQITAAEMNSLSVQIAAPEVFRAQGMDYSSAARSVQVSLQRNPDGTASLRLSSNTPINEPFVDLVIDSQWSTGNLVRTYTLLLDPPASQRRAAPAPTPAQVTPPVAAAPAATPSPAPRPRATAPTPAAAAPAATEPRNDSLRVQAGDTAGRLANANRPNGVSLDQMLVAMLRSNPKAFINGNVNRIRAGAVVQMPSREQALETSASEARQIVAAQSRDFNTYRRSLASKAPQATVQAADRSSGGQVQAHVEDASAAAATPDKLTLSKGAVQSAAAEEKMAIQKQAEDQSNRLNELQRNLAELNELAQNNTAAKPAAPAAAAAPAAGEQPASTTATPGVEVAASNPAVTAAAPETPPPQWRQGPRSHATCGQRCTASPGSGPAGPQACGRADRARGRSLHHRRAAGQSAGARRWRRRGPAAGPAGLYRLETPPCPVQIRGPGAGRQPVAARFVLRRQRRPAGRHQQRRRQRHHHGLLAQPARWRR
ncbi:FimV family protein [Comamonas aquatica]|uniref:type IV pilus assembly protein FimV n=1 Tax=Comamonas aquatica TaxID=225991 RepID=UPI001E7BE5F4|nr:Tfp pilus assembly protein FimV [Comamonas aquatica]